MDEVDREGGLLEPAGAEAGVGVVGGGESTVSRLPVPVPVPLDMAGLGDSS